MKNRFMRGAALGLAMVTAFTFTAPNSALLSAEAAAKQATAATKITAKAASVKVGKTAKVKVTINKKATKKVTINVKAKNAKIAKVAKKLTIKKGKKAATLKVKGLKKGSTKLTLSFKNSKGKTVKKTIKVTVKKAAAAKVAATGVTLDKTAYTVGLGQSLTMFATPVPANTTDKATWTSSDETVATVADGVVTGVKEGKATITVAYNENATATAEVTVSKDAIIYNLTGVKQTAANKIELTFDNPEAKNLTQKGDVVIQNAAGTITLPVDSFAWDATGSVAIATLSISFTDKTEYNVSFKEGTPYTFTASVGEVASVAVTSATAQRGVDTKIEFMLLDANAMDVTSTVDLKNTITIDVDGTVENTDVSDPTKPTLRMSTVGDKAKVTVTYRKSDNTEIKGEAEITCVEASATVGKGIFKVVKDLTTNKYTKDISGDTVAKFYLSGMSDTSVSVNEDESEEYIYFYAQDENGNAIKYDEYKIDTSNNDIAGAEIKKGENDSKFVQIKVSGNKKGNVNLNLTATKNNIDTPYTIPVTVKEKAKLSSIVIKANKSTITNAYDVDYYGEITVQAKDTNGEVMKLDSVPSLEFNKKDQPLKVISGATATAVERDDTVNNAYGFNGFYFANSTDAVTGAVGTIKITDPNTYSVDTNENTPADRNWEYKAFYSAYKADGGSYTVKATATQDGVTKSSTVTIKVDEIPSAAWDSDGTVGRDVNGVSDVKYAVELKDSTRDFNNGDVDTEAMLYATAGSKFIGYVRNGASTSSAVAIGGTGVSNNAQYSIASGGAVTVKSDASTQVIRNVRQYVKNSSGKISNSATAVRLYDAGVNVNSPVSAALSCGIDRRAAMAISIADKTAANIYVVGDSDSNAKYFAKTGKYTVTFTYEILHGKDKDKDASATSTLTVNNTMAMPSVNVTTRKVDSLSSSTIKEVLTTNVDLNNNTSAYDSISDNMYSKYKDNVGTTATESSDGKQMTIKYVEVKEPMNGYRSAITFVVPINTTFILNN